MTISEYEAKQEANVFKWILGIFGVLMIFVIYNTIVNSYQPTGKKSELLTIEANIKTSEQSSSFLVRIADKQIEGGFRCRSEPIKTRAKLFYRMAEVKTVTGKLKFVPDFDDELSCKSIMADVKVS